MSKDYPKRRVGIINGGGDCPGINTVIDSIVRVLEKKYEILGFVRGFEGLYTNEYMILDRELTNNYKFHGGTFLKTVNKGNFPGKTGLGQKQPIDAKVLEITQKNYKDLKLQALIVIGGDGTLTIASTFCELGIPVICVPKSIDNDLQGTLFSFGFLSSVEIATEALDKLETTSFSHDRVMILEVMGRNAGWISLFSGIAGGANVILIPEIEFSFENVLEFLKKRGKPNALIVVAEGASPKNSGAILSDLGENSSEVIFGGIGEKLAKYLNTESDFEARCTKLGHIQRGGSPISFDRILSRQYGVAAAQALLDGEFGKMVSFDGQNFGLKKLEDCVNILKNVKEDSSMVDNAKQLGIYFGG